MTPRTALAAGLLVAGTALAGCGADVSVGSAAPASPTTATTTPTTAAPGTTSGIPGGAITKPPTAGGGNAGELPAGFPLPPGTTVGPVAVQGEEIAATLTVPDGKQANDYWRQRLPGAGYTITKAEMVGGIGEITFTGNGCVDGSQLGISGQDIVFECKRA